MKICAKTSKGLVRTLNQDAVNYGFLGDDFCWVLVCDGLGGQNSGEIASNLAVEVVENVVKNEYNKNLDKNQLVDLLKLCLEKANLAIFNKSTEEIQHCGMGTTAVLAFVKNDEVHIAYVGDSRAYLIKNNEIFQLTVDHSMVQEMLESGEITEDEAKIHPRRNIITRAMGTQPDLKIDYVEEKILDGEFLNYKNDNTRNF